MKPVVAIVGRPNVGKSTLFNKLIGRKKAIVADEPGVTRDLNFADVDELGRQFTIVDTGGFEAEASEGILFQVKEQTRLAIEDSDVIVFLMDSKAGPTPGDIELVEMLRKVNKPVLYAANKVDSTRQETAVNEFYSLGISGIFPVSAEHARGIGELLEAIVKSLPPAAPEPSEDEFIKVAIVGRPNVGKSSILNRVLGAQRSIVSDVAGTTRDPVDSIIESGGKKYIFIDTAGIRKKSKVSLTVENYSVMEAIRSIDRCDVAILVLDAAEGVRAQDEKIAGLIEDRKKCCIIAVNKWDSIEKETDTTVRITESIRASLPFVSYAPIVFISALTGQRVNKVLETVDMVAAKSRQRVTTGALNRAMEEIILQHRPPSHRGKEVKLYYATQTGTSPPTFVIFTNIPEGVQEGYRRYIVNRLRETLSMEDVPIRVFYRKRQ